MKRAIAYIRVSTAQQELSPDAQRERLQQFAAFNGYTLHNEDIIVDVATSGRVPFEERELGKEALRRLESADVIIFAKLSRAFRNAADALTLVPKLIAAGKDVAFLDIGISVSTSTGKMIFGILAVMAEWEADIIAERTRECLDTAQKNGKRIGGLPLGYRSTAYFDDTGRKHNGGVWEAVPEELAAVKRIRQLREQAGLSFREIARKLQREGMPTKRGGRWQSEQVRRAYLRETK